MAVPSRAYVGILTFAILASLAVVPYTGLILAGYRPPADAPHELLFPEPAQVEPGTMLVLVLASLFCLTLTFAAWRGLLGAARRDAQARKQRAQATAAVAYAPESAAKSPGRRDEEPPGYQ